MLYKCFLLLALTTPLFAQTESAGTASIAGRITRGEQSVFRMLVTVKHANQLGGWELRGVSVRTDSDGQFRVTGLKAGNYLVFPHVLSDVLVSDGKPTTTGKTVVIADGEHVRGIDFTVMPGGVISGTITDEDGKPVIGQEVTLLQYWVRNSNGERAAYFSPILYQINRTNDRGAYRIFGLPPGKYLVRVGKDEIGTGSITGNYPTTYYPIARNEGAAKVIEVATGAEITGIDIKIGKLQKSYSARGRIVDAATGAPVAGLRIRSVIMKNGEAQLGLRASDRTNGQGEFLFERLLSGHYVAHLEPEEGSGYYSDPVEFDVTKENVNGLELKATRGGSISGNVAIIGTNDPQILARLQTYIVGVHYPDSKSVVPPTAWVSVQPDGSFRITGLRPGKLKLIARAGGMKAFTEPRSFILRAERGQADVTEGLLLQAGEQVSGVQMLVSYGTAKVRGQINFVGGELPAGTVLHIGLRSMDDYRMAQVDVNGRFVFEGLLAGEHQLVVNLPSTLKLSGAVRQQFYAPQKIMVAANAETLVTFTVDLRLPEK